jgi:hypothetical protein
LLEQSRGSHIGSLSRWLRWAWLYLAEKY